MGNNYVKQLGIKSDTKIGIKEFNAIWEKYAEKDNTIKRKNAIKFLKDFSHAINLKYDDEIIQKLLFDAGVHRNEKTLSKEIFTNLFFINAETAAVTGQQQQHLRSILSVRGSSIRVPMSARESVKYRTQSFRPVDPPTPTQLHIPDSTPRIYNTRIGQELVALFEKYSSLGEDSNVIQMQGMVAFLRDLELNPMDLAFLVIGYHLKAEIIGIFTKEKFVTGFAALNLGSLEAIKAMIPTWRQVQNPDVFKNIFRYAHQFYREKPTVKTLPIETTINILGILIPNQPYISQFQKFLLIQKEYKAINMDQWINIYDFFSTISEESLKDYSEGSSWPYLFDLFVEWLKEDHSDQDIEETKEAKDNDDIYLDCKYYKL